jgi:hypothetical protein
VASTVSASAQLTGIAAWTSSPASPKDSVEMAPSANSIGARSSIAPEARVPSQLTNSSPNGISSSRAAAIAK